MPLSYSGQTIGTEVNAITGLPEMTWRDLDTVPYDMANISGGWDRSRGAYPFIDGVSHYLMGRKETPMQFRLYFLNTLAPGMFPGLFSKWFEAVAINGEPDTLLHPIRGKVDAVVDTWDIELTATRTAGVVMNVTWVDTVLDPDKGQELKADILFEAKAAATACDSQMAVLGIDYPTGERTTSFTDMIGQINGLIFSARLRLAGMVNQAAGIVRSVTDVVEQLDSAKHWALKSNLKTLYMSLLKLQKSSLQLAGRRTSIYVLTRWMTLTEVADEKGNTLAEIMGLNPTLLGLPNVPKGTPVSYFL